MGTRRISSEDRALRPQRLPEIAGDDAAEPLEVLHVDRLIESELGAQVLQVLAVGLLVEHELDDVARDQTRQAEDDKGRDHQRRDRDQKSPQDVLTQAT
jgi:hypothetical protein